MGDRLKTFDGDWYRISRAKVENLPRAANTSLLGSSKTEGERSVCTCRLDYLVFRYLGSGYFSTRNPPGFGDSSLLLWLVIFGSCQSGSLSVKTLVSGSCLLLQPTEKKLVGNLRL